MHAIERILQLRKKKGASETTLLYVFLDKLMEVTTDSEVLKNEALNIMLAGNSTTASLLLSIFYELTRNPEIWAKLRAEIIELFGKWKLLEELAKLTFESFKRCVYLWNVINETLRLYPPLLLNLRKAIQEKYLHEGEGSNEEDPCLINKEEYVPLHVYFMHGLEDIFGHDAAVYNPDRWTSIYSKVGSAFMPFVTGRRVCLGLQYALTEASYATVRLMQMFANIESHNCTAYSPPKRITATLQFSDCAHVALSWPVSVKDTIWNMRAWKMRSQLQILLK